MRTITQPVSFACMCQACVHWLVHAYQYYGIVINISIDPSRWRWFPVFQQLSKQWWLWWWDSSQEALCAPLYASECTRMHLRTPSITKMSCGSMPPDPPRVNGCWAAMFSTSANDIAPPHFALNNQESHPYPNFHLFDDFEHNCICNNLLQTQCYFSKRFMF